MKPYPLLADLVPVDAEQPDAGITAGLQIGAPRSVSLGAGHSSRRGLLAAVSPTQPSSSFPESFASLAFVRFA